MVFFSQPYFNGWIEFRARYKDCEFDGDVFSPVDGYYLQKVNGFNLPDEDNFHISFCKPARCPICHMVPEMGTYVDFYENGQKFEFSWLKCPTHPNVEFLFSDMRYIKVDSKIWMKGDTKQK